jgi:MSHA biogenesis protein MshO
MSRRHPARGFTLVELVLVIVVTSVMAATLVVFFKPAITGYLASRARADLTDQADTALRRMVRDVRLAVPNSVRTPGSQCFEVVPTRTGGRFRNAPDTVNNLPTNCSVPGATCAAPLDTSQATTVFDVLTPLSVTPAVGDWVVVGNQNPGDLYGGATRSAISTAVTTPAAAYGKHRITVASKQFPLGYDGGRFTVVPGTLPAVFYICSGADGTLDASGNGKGTLYRLMRDFSAPYPSACPATTSADVLATRVLSCNFVYDPNQGATQQSGFVWMQLELARAGETAHMAIGAHIANGP